MESRSTASRVYPGARDQHAAESRGDGDEGQGPGRVVAEGPCVAGPLAWALDRVEDAVAVCKPDGTVLYLNHAAEQLLTVERGALLGRNVARLFQPTSVAPLLAAMASCPVPWHDRLGDDSIMLDGARAGADVVPLAVRVLRDDTGPAPVVGLVMRDASRIMAQELRLARSLRSLFEVLDRLFDPAVIVRDRVIIYANDAMTRILAGEDGPALPGVPVTSVVHPSDRDPFCRHLVDVLERGGAQEAIEVRFMAGTGGPVTLEIAAISVEHGGGSAVLLLGRDLSKRRRREAQSMQEDRMVAVGTLAAGIAHEINTPVQFVSDSVHFLQEASGDVFALVEALQRLRHAVAEGADAERLRELLQDVADMEEQADLEYLEEHVPAAFGRVVEGMERVSTIVRSMKEFSHPSSGEREPFDLNRAVEMTVTIARNEYKYVADLELDLAPVPPIQGFPDEINQVILNLVVNAAHAIADASEGTDRRGTLTVRTRCEDDSVVLEVQDTGTGIPEGLRERIFEPFFTTKEVGKGTGQGLALAWRVVVEHHGGQIWLESEIGRGTTFFVRLPMAGGASRDGAGEVKAAS